MATALLVISAVTAVAGAVQQRKIGKAQRKQNQLSNKIAAIGRTRKTKQAIAASRIQIAQQQSAGFQLGVSGSTSVAGAVAGVRGDTASAIGQSNLETTGAGFIADLSNKISGFQSNVSTLGAVSSITGGLAGNDKAVAGLEDFLGIEA